MDNSFTHILCVKVWSPHLKMTSNYGNILSIIKTHIVDTNMHFVSESVETTLNWRINQFEKPYDEMFAGDLVANMSLHFENKIYELTKEILKDIEEKLKAQDKLSNGEIIDKKIS
jgi:muramidase (phage lysozyme)